MQPVTSWARRWKANSCSNNPHEHRDCRWLSPELVVARPYFKLKESGKIAFTIDATSKFLNGTVF